MKLWYNNSASEWTQALPLGNGFMGAMCFGGAEGLFELSENTCWSGKTDFMPFADNAAEEMAKARAMLLQGRYDEADRTLESCVGIKANYGTQLPMGRLRVTLEAPVDRVYRELELESGIERDILTSGGATVCRESFISHPDQVMCVHMHTGGARKRMCLWLEGWSQPSKTQWDASENRLTVDGIALENMHSDGLHGVAYVMQLQYATDGRIEWNRRGLTISDATELTLYLAAATDMFEDDPLALCSARIQHGVRKGIEALRADHIAEHSEAMNRCVFKMPDTHVELPTDARIRQFRQARGGDDGLIALFFQYGRYLLFNSSRPDSRLPAALQGVWNDYRACRMEWTDDMHLDINTQMNYYPAENTGLGDCALPLMRWIKDVLMPCGKAVARKLYGMDGWCAHTVSNAFGWAAPGWDVNWGFGLTCGSWAATHIWEHYLYTNDKAFLSEYYEVLYGCAKFFSEALMPAPDSDELVIVPSYSPENVFIDKNGRRHTLSIGGTYDMTVVRALFSIVRQAAALLGKEDDFTRSLADTLEKLPPYRVGKHGQLMEWYYDFDEAYPDHRHTSHLLAMHPFNMIDPAASPALGKAINTTLDRRLGDNARDIVYANWAGALLITHYARLLDGEKAGEFVKPMIAFLSRDNMMITHQGPTTSISGGIYELDGNTGFTSAVAQMLLQSYGGVLRILPALPEAWQTGSISGLRAYGGHRVSISWDASRITGSIEPARDENMLLRCFGHELSVDARAGQSFDFSFERRY